MDSEGIDRLFSTEISYLAVMTSEIFEEEGFEELAYYLLDPIPASPQSVSSG